MFDLLGKLVDPVSNILDKVIEDKDQKAKLAHEIATMAEKNSQALMMQQLEILKLMHKVTGFKLLGVHLSAGFVVYH